MKKEVKACEVICKRNVRAKKEMATVAAISSRKDI